MVNRYLIREILKPSVVVFGLLVLLFTGFSWVAFLGEAVNSLLPVSMIFTLIALKVGIALELLMPISLYFGIILGLGRLYADSEMKALMACGISPYQVLTLVFALSCFVAVLVGGLSLYLRPLAYEKSYQLKAEGEASFRISNLDAGHFYERNGGSLVFFAEEIDQKRNRLNRVFVQSEHENNLRIISAKEAEELVDPQSGTSIPVLLDGVEYQFTRDGDITHISGFSRLAIYPRPIQAKYKRKASSTQNLMHSGDRRDIAELQWRFSTPFSTVLLALLGVPLSRAAPRQGKYAKIFTATVVFAGYYFLGLMIKTLIDEAAIPALPGIWLIVIGFGVLLAFLLVPSRFTKGIS
ncbi:MAG: LPS export ABC transporter permease LptF [Nitrospirales bacterium]